MSEREFVYVFSYDISRPKARRRVAATLEDRAVRVQYSVFEARLSHKKADALFRMIEPELGDGDSLRMYALSAVGLEHTRVAGAAMPPTDQDYWLV